MNVGLSQRVGTLLLLLAFLAGGCTAVGYSIGADIDDSRKHTPVAIEQAAEIEHGTPVQVGLADGGHVRGIWLGLIALDSAGVMDGRAALRLGSGNRPLLDHLFAKGLALPEPTPEQVPDTVVFALDGIRGLGIPVSSRSGQLGMAAGVATDTAIAATAAVTTVTVLVSLAIAAIAGTLLAALFGK